MIAAQKGPSVTQIAPHSAQRLRRGPPALLSTLDAGSLQRLARHKEDGLITLEHMLHEWAFHDLGHVRQIAELVRAQVYYPNIGPWKKKYSVHP